MALIKCKDCGSELSKSAKKCPKCGKENSYKYLEFLQGVGALFVVGFLIYSCSSHQEKKQPILDSPSVVSTLRDSEEITLARSKVIDALKAIKLKPNWQEVQIKDNSETDYTLWIWYKKMPTSNEVKKDTTEMVRAVLKTLATAGKRPAQDMAAIFVHAAVKASGESQQVTYNLGKASYVYRTDSIEFVKK